MVFLYDWNRTMTASKAGNIGAKALSATIRRQIGTTANRSLLARLPIFAPQNDALPERIDALLDALDSAEEASIAPGNPAKG